MVGLFQGKQSWNRILKGQERDLETREPYIKTLTYYKQIKEG